MFLYQTILIKMFHLLSPHLAGKIRHSEVKWDLFSSLLPCPVAQCRLYYSNNGPVSMDGTQCVYQYKMSILLSFFSRLWKPSCQKKHLGNILQHNYTAWDDLQHSSHTCQLCLTESHNWLHFFQHGRLFIVNSVHKPLEGGARYPHVIYLQDSNHRWVSSRPFPSLPMKNKSNTISEKFHKALLNPVGHLPLTHLYW